MRCFFCENLDDNHAKLNDMDIKHLFSVLRAKPGTKILLIDGRGNKAEAVIENNKQIKIESLFRHNEPKIKIHLYVAPPRKQKMDILLSQCTEAGVWTIHPILTENAVALPKKENTTEKWNIKIIEACKQAHNPFIPEISPCISFNQAIENIAKQNVPAFYGSTEFVQNHNISENIRNFSEAAWFVGPEGGFSKNEIRLMQNKGFQGISIGNWVMRVETAAVIGTALLQQIL